mmetsp:Transcript_12926/g.24009  ORF Transcript_12926/g.24009 Transcript_12926/m.24009 type:complete len:146 (+) Transcript_12926:679-1116(+)|eukprot:CAMPEP_0204903168 /NCGR_PEP_ID=MMETSP1397-20131031/4088_1 /ASSEMBLY_ACC=CAM_ASM_000891 /TAXON_ID=49980 /ORGANISM="Climacostomum Climacostomum virens, Strain Stock W-24" /LENGTH=145 /DNA_ID=CAMNT_0052071757 /DNA_START=569 /DNA_END=1006 /DNA_ORIENTATION=+
MATYIPKRINLKHAFGPSILSRMDPNNLTSTDKLMLARARIWGNIIGGNVKTGSRFLRERLQWPAKGAYFDYADFRNYVPFHPAKDTFDDEIKEDRESRVSRRGKTAIILPSRTLREMPKWKRVSYLVREERRKSAAAGGDKKKK